VLPEGLVPDRNGSINLKELGQIINDCHNKCAEEIYDELKIPKQKTTKITIIQSQNGDYGKNFDEHDYEIVDENGQEVVLSKEELRILEREWKKNFTEAATYAKQRGKLPGNIERMLEKILAPIVNWKELLHKFVVNTLPVDNSWSKPNKKGISFNMYLPINIRENIEVVVAPDLSGSTKNDYTRFMSEMIGMNKIFGQMKMRVLMWDTRIISDLEATNGNIEKILTTTPYEGGGGTTFGCVTEYMKDKGIRPKLLVVFTDGFIESNPEIPNCENLLWILTYGGCDNYIKKCGGVVIKMNKEDHDEVE
jgi:hypothetical protein